MGQNTRGCMAAFFFAKSDVITVIMYYDQSIKPLRDSNRLYYAAITTNHRIANEEPKNQARLGNGARPQLITSAPDIACPPRDGVRRRTPHGSSETARPNSALIRARIDSH